MFWYHYTSTDVGGTRSCDTLKAIGDIFIASGVFALVTVLCYSVCCLWSKSSKKNIDTGLGVFGCLACIPLTAVVGLTIGESAAIAGGVENGTLLHGGGELASCRNTEIPIILNAFSWVLCLLLFCCGCLFFCDRNRSKEEDLWIAPSILPTVMTTYDHWTWLEYLCMLRLVYVLPSLQPAFVGFGSPILTCLHDSTWLLNMVSGRAQL